MGVLSNVHDKTYFAERRDTDHRSYRVLLAIDGNFSHLYTIVQSALVSGVS